MYLTELPHELYDLWSGHLAFEWKKTLHQRQFKAQIKWIVQYKYACKRILCNKSNEIIIGDIDPMLLSSYS